MLQQMKFSLRKSSGFTLIEMLIVIAILGILASIAVPAYQDSVRKSRRAQLKVALMEAAQQFERCFTQSSTFVGCTTPTQATIEASANNFYTVTITPTASTYTISAAAAALGGQNKDTNCATMSINQAGIQSSADSGGTATTNCW